MTSSHGGDLTDSSGGELNRVVRVIAPPDFIFVVTLVVLWLMPWR